MFDPDSIRRTIDSWVASGYYRTRAHALAQWQVANSLLTEAQESAVLCDRTLATHGHELDAASAAMENLFNTAGQIGVN